MSVLLSLLTPLLSSFLRYSRHAKASYVSIKRLIDPNYILPLEKLPTEINLMIVSHLDPLSQVCLRKACRHFWPDIHVPSRELSPRERAIVWSLMIQDLMISRCNRMDGRISASLPLDSGDGRNTRNHCESRQPRRTSSCPRAIRDIEIRLRQVELRQREAVLQLEALARRVSAYSASR